MYELFYSPGACSLATHVLLNELGVETKLTTKSEVSDFSKINPAMTVPVLIDEGTIFQEGAAIALYLMEKHKSPLLPTNAADRSRAIQWMMFANASVHPAYSKMFFVNKALEGSPAKADAMTKASKIVSDLWAIVEIQLGKTPFVSGQHVSMADIMLTVYANWNSFFPGQLTLGKNSLGMIENVSSRPAFKDAVHKEKAKFKVS